MNELCKKLTRLQWLLHKRQMRGWVSNNPLADITRGQGRILAVLKLRDGISSRDLSYLLGIRVSSLNELLLKMEKNGYITREPSEQDKRVILIKLTDKGRDEQQQKPFDFDDVFSCLAEDEQTAFGEYLDRIADAIQANAAAADDDWDDRIDALREKLGDIGAFFEEQGRDFFGWRGFYHGPRPGNRSDHFRRDGYRDYSVRNDRYDDEDSEERGPDDCGGA